MADSETQALRAGPEILSGAALPFRFEITWRSVTRSLEPTPAPSAAAVTRISTPPPTRRAPVHDVEAKEWEMVLPRMRKRVTTVGAPAAALPGALEAAPQAAPVQAPNFGIPAESVSGSRGKKWAFVGVPLVLAAGVAAMYWNGQSSTTSDAPPAMEMGSVGWVTEWASDRTGSSRGRQISLYRPSAAMSDYRLEFLGQISRKSLGWVFRASDTKNYYVGKLEYVGAMRTSPLSVTHFAVINGVEGPHVQRILAHSPGAALRVRLDARGSQFTVSVQGQVVEDWQDDRLKSGAVGFLNEREEQAQISSIQISFPKGVR